MGLRQPSRERGFCGRGFDDGGQRLRLLPAQGAHEVALAEHGLAPHRRPMLDVSELGTSQHHVRRCLCAHECFRGAARCALLLARVLRRCNGGSRSAKSRFNFETRRGSSPVPWRQLDVVAGSLEAVYLVRRHTSPPSSLAERGNRREGASPTQALAGLEGARPTGSVTGNSLKPPRQSPPPKQQA